MKDKVLIQSVVPKGEEEKVNDEVGLKDMIAFLKRNQWVIIFFGVAGLLLSAVYLVSSPNKYEARWQMQMAQFVNNSSININIDINNINNSGKMVTTVILRRLLN